MAAVRIKSQYKYHIVTMCQRKFKEQTERSLNCFSNLPEITDDKLAGLDFAPLSAV